MKLIAGPLVGFRAWKVDEDYVLRSLNDNRVWTPQLAMEARCRESHRVPQRGCTCGWYAYKRSAAAAGPVRGTAALWGPVVAHALGWRARFAYPLALWGQAGRDIGQLHKIAELYGCQVTAEPVSSASQATSASAQARLRQESILEQEFGVARSCSLDECARRVLPFRLFNMRQGWVFHPNELSCCLLPEPICQRIAELGSRQLTVHVATYKYGEFGRPRLHDLLVVTPMQNYIAIGLPWPCGRCR